MPELAPPGSENPVPRRILLLDMDGVLIATGGYHLALRHTVERIGDALGYRQAGVTPADIDVFEAVGLAREWDSGSLCVAALLRQVLPLHPEASLPAQPPLPHLPCHDLPLPDFQKLARALAMLNPPADNPLSVAPALFADGSAPEQGKVIDQVLLGSLEVRRSLVHRMIQEYNLGSQLFSECYGLPSGLNTPSYLLVYDRPSISPEMARNLESWSNMPGQQAVIVTNRPSLPPADFPGTPEDELGMQVLGTPSIPIVGSGGLTWLGSVYGLGSQSMLKPSPVHALAGFQVALGSELRPALERAARLALKGELHPSWQALSGARVLILEDSSNGIRSAAAAGETLCQSGIGLELALYGVTDSAAKQTTLERLGARVFPDTEQALRTLLR
jgi:hypothetical protein